GWGPPLDACSVEKPPTVADMATRRSPGKVRGAPESAGRRPPTDCRQPAVVRRHLGISARRPAAASALARARVVGPGPSSARRSAAGAVNLRGARAPERSATRSEEHTSELHHVKISYAVFCLKKK